MKHGSGPEALSAVGHWLSSKISSWDWTGLDDGLVKLRAAIEQGLHGIGTLGAPYMDYIIADATIIPDGAQVHYTEQVVRVPYSYQVNDRSREISDRHVMRAELGLPEDGFVFASFNNGYKLAPESFDIWMRLLNDVPGSVLWLLGPDAAANEKLREEARRRGVSTARLVFALLIDPAQHLRRYLYAGLFLDTFNCNAHTTAVGRLAVGDTGREFIFRPGRGQPVERRRRARADYPQQ